MSIFKNTLMVSLVSVVPTAVNFFLTPFFAKKIGVEGFGVLNSMQILSAILLIVFALLVDKSIYRLIHENETEEKKKKFLGTIFISILVLVAFFTITSILLNGLFTSAFPGVPFNSIILVVIITSAITVVNNYYLIVLQARIFLKEFVIVSLVYFVLSTGSVLVYLIVHNSENVLTGYFIIGLANAIVLFAYVIVRCPGLIIFTFNFKQTLNALKYSIPFIPYMLSGWILNMSDRIFIGKFYSQADIGVYSLGFKIASVIGIITSSFFIAYNPLFYSIVNSNDDENKLERIKEINNIFLLFLFPLSAMVMWSSDLFVRYFFSIEFLPAIRLAKILCISVVFAQLQSFYTLMLSQSKKTGVLSTILTLGAVLVFVLNYFLIKNFGVIFGVIDSVLVNIFILLLLIKEAKKNFYIPMEQSLIAVTSVYYIIVLLEFILINVVLRSVLSFAITFVYIGYIVLDNRVVLIQQYHNILGMVKRKREF
jgi:O-antigen/teichoic acid export membrane protein